MGNIKHRLSDRPRRVIYNDDAGPRFTAKTRQELLGDRFDATAGTAGGALTFDGDGDYLTTASADGFTFGTDPFTMECWPVKILQSTFLDWTPCFSQLRPGFSFLRIAIP